MSRVRELILDTETTGLDPEKGDKLVEIGLVELIGHRPTGEDRHFYINPQRSVPIDAYNIHGLDYEFLKDKPIFSEIADEFLSFIDKDIIIAHNASFDLKFINAELKLSNREPIKNSQTFCTFEYAKRREGNKRASLDALSKEFKNKELDRLTENRTKKGGHGALLDSYILAEVYLALIGGREPDMFEPKSDFGNEKILRNKSIENNVSEYEVTYHNLKRSAPLPERITKEEKDNHKEFIKRINGLKGWFLYN